MTIQQLDKLYKLDNKGKLRVWWMEIDGDKIRNTSGLDDGEKVTSDWKLMQPKNEGRANATTPEQQAVLEAEAMYEKQLGKGGYHRDIADAGVKKYVEPMLAIKYEDTNLTIADLPVISQPKLDGHRCIAMKSMLQTRGGKRYASVPHIEFELLPVFDKYPDLILDGELYHHELKQDFNELSSLVRKQKPTAEQLQKTSVMQYHVYDLVDPTMTFIDRMMKLKRILQKFDLDHVVVVATSIRMLASSNSELTEWLDDLYGQYADQGYEGQMVRLNALYELDKRSKSLIKRKEWQDMECTVTAILEGEGNGAGKARAVSYRTPDGVEGEAGIIGNNDFTQALLENADQFIGGDVTIKYFNRTPAGKLRFAKAKAFFPGKRDI